MVDINSIDQKKYFEMARTFLLSAFKNPDNAHLHVELSCNFGDLEIVNDKIRINLNDEGFDTMEALLEMNHDEIELGYYSLILDIDGNVVDDVLVIHDYE